MIWRRLGGFPVENWIRGKFQPASSPNLSNWSVREGASRALTQDRSRECFQYHPRWPLVNPGMGANWTLSMASITGGLSKVGKSSCRVDMQPSWLRSHPGDSTPKIPGAVTDG